ncbi:hypothetical protein PCANC_22617 [Puccinia coronata f. sp. avenae]|uniref:Uncharacterized protein n=1 Tax=Puccinia coronata f. sp. avenae TaxID=200324 RepID=A0A2N5S5K9_9BASI|nr:hypothetical protein PCANC_22617 [Puccinia coronata f. sp. avenae]
MEGNTQETPPFNHQQSPYDRIQDPNPGYQPYPIYRPNSGYPPSDGNDLGSAYHPNPGDCNEYVVHNQHIHYDANGPLPDPVKLINRHTQIGIGQGEMHAGLPSLDRAYVRSQSALDPATANVPLSGRAPRLLAPAERTLKRLVAKKAQIVTAATTRKPKRSCEEIDAANNLAAAKRTEKARKAAETAEAKRQKLEQKEARATLKSAASAATTP